MSLNHKVFFDANSAKRLSNKEAWEQALLLISNFSDEISQTFNKEYLENNLIVTGNFICEFLYISIKKLIQI